MSTVNKTKHRGTLQHATAQRLITRDDCLRELYISCKQRMPNDGQKVLGYIIKEKRWAPVRWMHTYWWTGFIDLKRTAVSHWIDFWSIPAPSLKGDKNG